MTRTRTSAQLHPSLDDSPPPEPEPEPPAAPIEVTLEGTCTDCGDRISTARLKALPSAERCVACQRDFESR
ncbi:MAG TPA: TraR/DksA C4-type zinc finger protein [Thermoleophilaceae bacterium]|nr:TraR/DksA C4-type zinc finger protein [Thermoleophilaceae bacterium]